MQVQLVSGGDGWCRAEMVVAPEHENKLGTLHGGLTATLVDTISSIALGTRTAGVLGVTVDLHVS
jgi:acyl-coenzyme A thioesterase 13